MVIVVITAIIMVVGSDPWCATMGKSFIYSTSSPLLVEFPSVTIQLNHEGLGSTEGELCFDMTIMNKK